MFAVYAVESNYISYISYIITMN